MPAAGLIEIPPVSNVIPFPMSPRLAFATAVIRQHHELRRLVATPRYAEKRPHAHLGALVAFPDREAQPVFFRHLAGARRELRRRQHVRGFVRQVAREVRRFRDDHTAFRR
jgi:hypothetical protein